MIKNQYLLCRKMIKPLISKVMLKVKGEMKVPNLMTFTQVMANRNTLMRRNAIKKNIKKVKTHIVKQEAPETQEDKSEVTTNP